MKSIHCAPSRMLAASRTRLSPRAFTVQARHASRVSESSPHPAPTIPSSPSTAYTTATHLLPQTASAETQKTVDLADRFLLPVYARPEFVLSHGHGSWVWDTDGRKYLDFSAGIAVNALGHGDADFVKAMEGQATKILHTSNVYHNEWAPRLAELLVTLTQREGGLGFPTNPSTPPSSGAKVFFANSGTEATEGALKAARKIGKDRGGASKTRIACFAGSFHGRSMGALSVTANPKYQAPFAPLLPGVDVGQVNDEAGLADLIGTDTCAVIVEPIQGEGGINTASEEWLRALRQRCDQVGAVLIYDEIQCGLYRSGTLWAHSTMPADCHPDIVTMAKPLANGYPIGAVLLRDEIAHTMTAGTHGTTFGGSPLACALGHHVLSRLSARSSVAHVAEISAYLTGRLERLPGWFPDVLQPVVRGRGLIRGLGLRDPEHAGRVVGLARERGVFVLSAGKDAVRLVPSLNVEKEEVDFAVDVLESSLGLISGS